MGSNNRAPVHGAATNDDEKGIEGPNHVERAETLDNEISLAKVEADAKLDEFGARSKTNPAEIALVKKLDRTILVSAKDFEDITLIADSDSDSLCSGLCTCTASARSSL